MTLAAISNPFVLDFEELDKQVTEDPFLTNIINVIATNPTGYPHLSKIEATLCYKGQVVLPATSLYIPCLLWEFHSSPMGGHVGVRHTYNSISS